MISWWKCQIVDGEKMPGSFEKDEILYAKNGETSITLFNGVSGVTIPKTAVQSNPGGVNLS